MGQADDRDILWKLQRIIDTQEVLRDYVSNLKERMSTLEAMLGTQMVQFGHLQQRIDRIEADVRKIRRPDLELGTPPEIH